MNDSNGDSKHKRLSGLPELLQNGVNVAECLVYLTPLFRA